MNEIYDLLIRGGKIVNGTGGEPFAGDVAMQDGIIVGVGGSGENSHHGPSARPARCVAADPARLGSPFYHPPFLRRHCGSAVR